MILSGDELPTGTVIANRYTIEKHFDHGGCGNIYLARTYAGDVVALKIALNGTENTCWVAESIRRETKMIRIVNSPYTQHLLDAGVHDGNPFYAYTFFWGVSLLHLLRISPTGRLKESTALPIMRQLALALRACHKQHIIHRDLKPENILVRQRLYMDPVVQLIDFGHALNRKKLPPDIRSWTLVGTPEYLTPEQAEPDWVKARFAVDVYVWGEIFYELLAGKSPYPQIHRYSWKAEEIRRIQNELRARRNHPITRVPHASPAVEQLILKALRFSPRKRYQDGTALVRALNHLPRPTFHLP